MSIWEAILLGVIQGVFMFFPVSSTAHMTLMESWLIGHGSRMLDPDTPEMIFFKLLVHVGTLVSILVVFRHSISQFLRHTATDLSALFGRTTARPPSRDWIYLRLAALGLFSVFVTGSLGLLLQSTFERAFSHPLAISATLVLTGVLLWFTDAVGPRPKGLRDLTILMALVIGLAQCLALVPGFSRSGLTIAFALFMGLKRRWAAQYSFFIAFPTILAATLVQSRHLIGDNGQLTLPTDQFLPYAIGFVVAALVGIAALYLVITLLYRAKFRYFAYYVWALAAVVAVTAITGGFDPEL